VAGAAAADRILPVTRMPLDLLDGPSRRGAVRSVFAGAVNIRLDAGDLLALHGPGPLRAPFALALGRWPLPDVPGPGAPVVVSGTRLRVGGAVLEAARARRVVTRVTPERAARAGLARAASALDDAPPPVLRGGAARVARAIADGDPAAFLAAALALLGLGEGLTPSGDDLLCGALAVLHRAASPLAADPRVIGPLAEATRERTTEVGRAFLLHALGGRFAEPVLDVVSGDPPRAARGAALLRALGASSGADTLAGVRLAALALPGDPGHGAG